MTLGDVINARRVLSSISEPVEFATAYKIAKFIDATETEQKLFDEKGKEILEKYQVDGVIPSDKENEADAEFNTLALTEVEKPSTKFVVDDFKGLKITSVQAFILLKFME